MSEFFIQDRQLSSITRTIVKDEKGKSLFLMVGRWGTKGDALSLYRLDGTLVASIKQISFTFGTRFEIYKDFEKVGTLQKIFNWPGDFIISNSSIGLSMGISTIIGMRSIISTRRSWKWIKQHY